MNAAFPAVVFLVCSSVAVAGEVAEALRQVDAKVLREGESLREMQSTQLYAQIRAANQRSTAAWRAIKTKADWEAHRARSLQALRASLGAFPEKPVELNLRTTAEHRGQGYVVRNVTYTSRPGLIVTANLYVPGPPRERSPGILLSHSHHSPKTQGELQDMGILWARAGCYVLAPDHLGHGERRQHPFATAADYPEKFQVGRQDYYFRYNVAMQLYAAGETLMGWMANDLMRGVDVLLAQKSIDADKIILLGAVAGGGDPAAVTAALDERIAAVVPFNFGGPQPETRFPLPEDAELRFNYAGGGSWESTRNLYRSAADGFLPWEIVGSVAPRRLIHAHEFAWDQERDPVWKRYQQIFAWYDKPQHLASTHGYGRVSLSSSEASHCNNIGKVHRVGIHRAFREWFGIEVDEEAKIERHPAEDLLCLGSSRDAATRLTPAREIAAQMAAAKSEQFERSLENKTADERLSTLQAAWQERLGKIEPYKIEKDEDRGSVAAANIRIERHLLHGPGGVRLPLVLLSPNEKKGESLVIVIAQQGKAAMLKQRADAIADLLARHAVCLVDVRGTGESRNENGRGRLSEDTELAATALMLGETPVASQTRNVRSAIGYLRGRFEFADKQILLYGDSLAEPNDAGNSLDIPLELALPQQVEPLGALLALLTALYEKDAKVLAANRGLESYARLCDTPCPHLPLDCIVPGAMTVGELPLLVKTLGNRVLPNAITEPVNAQNVQVKAGKEG